MLTPYKIKDYCEEYKPSWAYKCLTDVRQKMFLSHQSTPSTGLPNSPTTIVLMTSNHTQRLPLVTIGEFYYLWLLVFQLLTTRKKPERT